jgi:hypothetical protein
MPRLENPLKSNFPFCKWTTLRGSGEATILKVSYFVLLAVPFLAKLSLDANPGHFPIYLKLTFFSSLFLSVANLLYVVFCPRLVRRFDSANDLYRTHLEIFGAMRSTGLSDSFDASYQHCVDGFNRANAQQRWIRLLCWGLLIAGGGCAIAVVLERSYQVLYA